MARSGIFLQEVAAILPKVDGRCPPRKGDVKRRTRPVRDATRSPRASERGQTPTCDLTKAADAAAALPMTKNRSRSCMGQLSGRGSTSARAWHGSEAARHRRARPHAVDAPKTSFNAAPSWTRSRPRLTRPIPRRRRTAGDSATTATSAARTVARSPRLRVPVGRPRARPGTRENAAGLDNPPSNQANIP